MVSRAMAPATSASEVLGLTLVGAMLTLAIVEHWMLVLPVSTTALWRWAMRKRKASAEAVDSGYKNALRAEAAPLPEDCDDKLLHAR